MKLIPAGFRYIAAPALLMIAGFDVGCDSRQTGIHGTMSQHVITLTEASFQAEVLDSVQPVLVDFWATWCGPCKVMTPIVSELAEEYKGRVKVGKVDVDEQPALAGNYNISAIPTLLIFKNGEAIEQIVGLRSREELKAQLDALVATVAKTEVVSEP